MITARDRHELTRAAYRDRDETLRLLGFPSYRSYLRSPLWKIIRERAIDIHGRKCVKCSGLATQIHHAVYSREVLSGEDVRGLLPVCAGCHKAASLTKPCESANHRDGLRVRSLADTNQRLSRPSVPKEKRSGFFCPCGRRRKQRKEHCGHCLEAIQRKRESNAWTKLLRSGKPDKEQQEIEYQRFKSKRGAWW